MVTARVKQEEEADTRIIERVKNLEKRNVGTIRGTVPKRHT